jgi:serpin B
MKRRSLFFLLLFGTLALGLTGSFNPLLAADQADLTAIVNGNNSFAYDLYTKLAQEPGNLFFSPYSISTALAMTYAGAGGDTAKQMAKTLHFSLPAERLHPAMADVMKALNAQGKSYQLAVANALWGQKGFKFQPEFLEITNKYYGAGSPAGSGVREVDFVNEGNREKTRQTINQWVEKQTNNKIKDLIKPKILDAMTRLVLTNAIYFKGKWEYQFNAKETKEAPFYISDKEKQMIPMMRQTGEFYYTETEGVQILGLPYTGGDLAMVILLPKSQTGLVQLEKEFQAGNVQKWLSKLAQEKVEVSLPRFKLEAQFQLNQSLRELGMIDAFNENKADFSGMSKPDRLFIKNVIHKAFVEVNEEGTEASAATAVIMGIKSAPPKKTYVFRADHPFVFLIRDLRSGSILFMGRLTQPK